MKQKQNAGDGGGGVECGSGDAHAQMEVKLRHWSSQQRHTGQVKMVSSSIDNSGNRVRILDRGIIFMSPF
jgi:hypothetical protein